MGELSQRILVGAVLVLLGTACHRPEAPVRTLPGGAMVVLELSGGFVPRAARLEVSPEGQVHFSRSADGGCQTQLKAEELRALRTAVAAARVQQAPNDANACCDLVTTRVTTAAFAVASTRPFEPSVQRLVKLLEPVLRRGCSPP